MQTENRQSSYRAARRRVYDDDDNSTTNQSKQNGSVDGQSSNKTPVQSQLSQNDSQNKSRPIDPFLGTVAGRLAQEIHDEFLVCKICFESYSNPKCLSCLHTFCSTCIDKHISAEVTYNKYTDYRDFTCPLCRKRTQLPLGGVKRLPDNFLISGLTELVMRQRKMSSNSSLASTTLGSSSVTIIAPGNDFNSGLNPLDETNDLVNQLPRIGGPRSLMMAECEICSQVGRADRGHSTEPSGKLLTSANNHQSNDPNLRASSANLSSAPRATAKCLDCNKLLCESCVTRHRTTKVTKDHATFDLQSGKEIECKDHPGEPVRFYCEACSVCICVLCTFNEHREHEVTSFGEAVNNLRTNLTAHVEQAMERIVVGQEHVVAVNELSSLVNTLESQIHETAEHFIEVIQRHEQELVSELREFVGPENMQAIDCQLHLERSLEEAGTLSQELTTLLDGQEIDMLLAKPEACAKLGRLQSHLLGNLIELTPLASESVYFRPGSVQLGYLTTNALSVTDQYDYMQQPLSSSATSSLDLANRPCINSTASQTDNSIPPSGTPVPESATTTTNQAPPPPPPRQVRDRACVTEKAPMVDQETNTRPRGIQTTITYSDFPKESNSTDQLLAQLDANNNGGTVDLSSMDNLTRARVRRKLNERSHTLDHSGLPPTPAELAKVTKMTSTTPVRSMLTNGNGGATPARYNTRRYSSIEKRYF